MSANTAERCAKSAFDIILAMMLASLAVASAAITNLIVQSVDARIREADPAVALARFEAYPSGRGLDDSSLTRSSGRRRSTSHVRVRGTHRAGA